MSSSRSSRRTGFAVAGALAALVAVQQLSRSPETSEAAALLAQASAAQKAGKTDAAIDLYERAAAAAGAEEGGVERDAGLALSGLYLGQVPAPFTAAGVDAAVKAAARYGGLPELARTDPGRAAFLGRLDDWRGQLTQPLDRLAMIDAIIGIDAQSSRDHASQRVADEKLAASALGHDWPLVALALDRSAGDREAAAHAAGLLTGLAGEPSLARAAGDHEAWLRRAGLPPDQLEPVVRAHAALVGLDDPARKAILDGDDGKRLAAWLAAHPRDQEAATALAAIDLGAGRPADAARRFDPRPGWLTPDALQALVQARIDAGDDAGAASLLTETLRVRLPLLQRIARQGDLAVAAVRDGWLARADRDDFPAELRARLDARSDDDGKRVEFGRWVDDQVTADADVARLREAYQAESDVVALAIALGGIELRRASADPARRAAHLAAAERALLSVQGDAQDSPQYHLDLGQLYHRLDRSKDGDAELQQVLDRHEPDLALSVAATYRDLGLSSRARDLARGVQAGGVAPFASSAATMLAVMATSLAERKHWLEKADQGSLYVQEELAELDARLLLRQGHLDQAAAAFGKLVTAAEARSAVSDAVAANNAALLYLQRFDCTGDAGELAHAQRLLDRALRAAPSNAIGAGNAAALYDALGTHEVLSRWIDVDQIRVFDAEGVLLEGLLEGPLRAEVVAAIAANPRLRRGRELYRRAMTLAPQQPGGYRALATWSRRLDDAKGLQALRDELAARAGAFDRTAADDYRKRLASGELDAEGLAEADGVIARLASARDRLRGHPAEDADRATAAAIDLLDADARYAKAWISGDVAVAEAGVALGRQARAWTGFAGVRDVRLALLQVAVLRARPAVPALARRWAQRRSYRMTAFVRAALQDSPTVASALAAAPEVIAAVSDAGGASRPTFDAWLLGELTHKELPAGAAWRRDPAARSLAEIDALLDPGDPDAALVLGALGRAP